MRLSTNLLLWVVLISFSATSAAAENFLIVVLDDVGVDALEPFGRASEYPATPTINSLASAGYLFSNAWSNPVCAATRATIQTGRHGYHNGIGLASIAPGDFGLSLDEWTLPEMMESVGYSTAAFDKWGVSDRENPLAPNQNGWGHYDGTLAGVAVESYDLWTRTTDGIQELQEGYLTEIMFGAMTDWVAATPEPWIAYMATFAPHRPFHAPPDHLHSQDLTGIDPERTPRPFYLAAIEAIDTLLGQFLLQLDPDTLADTTIILLGDNGTTTQVVAPGWPPKHDKGTMYEGGVNVPVIIAGPRVPVPGVSNALFHTVDLFPTLLEIVGAELPPDITLDGISILPLLEDPDATVHEMIYAERFSPNQVDVLFDPVLYARAARNARGYKLISRYGDEEFYDLSTDPFEMRNILNRPQGLRLREQEALQALRDFLDTKVP